MSWSEVVDDIGELMNRNQAKLVENMVDIGGVKKARCGSCKNFVFSGDNFCTTCGQRLKWED